MKKNPVYLIGGWTADNRFVVDSWSNNQSSATDTLKSSIKDKNHFQKIHYNVYKVYPDEVVNDNEDLKFFDEAQKIIDELDIEGNIVITREWIDSNNPPVHHNISIYAYRVFNLCEKTKTLTYKVTAESYGDLKNKEMREDMYKELYDSLYCVEIPKMKKILRELDSNIRISIVDRNRCKVVKGFITK